MRNFFASAGVTLFMALGWLPQALAAATPAVVNVLLQDTSTDSAIGSMHIELDRHAVPSGRITFHAVNQSKELVHELIVVRTQPGQGALPYDDKKGEVVEKRIHRLGEIADLKPGASGAITLRLRPGSYILICNQPGHYKAGMGAALLVTK